MPTEPTSPSDPDVINDSEKDPTVTDDESYGLPAVDEPQGSQDIGEALQEATAAMRTLFATLVPPQTILIEDIFGTQYTVRGSLPARSQIQVVQALEGVFGAEADDTTRAMIVKAQSEGMEAIGQAIIGLATDPGILASIARAFTSAHEHAVVHAAAVAEKDGAAHGDAADLFAIEEMVAGLLPFFVRFGVRALNIADAMLPAPESVTKAA